MVTAITPKPKPVKAIKASKPRKPRPKKSSRQLLEVELDRLIRSIVFLRDGFCVTPMPEKGHSLVRQPGHLVTRSKRGVKWDLWNVNEQCSSCNMRHSLPNQWVYYDTWFIQHFGEGERLRVDADANEKYDLSIDDLMELRSQLTEIHARQQEDKTFKPRFSQKEILSGEWKMLDAQRLLRNTKEAEMT
jgi:hypothetical protein